MLIARDVPTAILSLIAVGGMGKSALTWNWFNSRLKSRRGWEGAVWWSFYERDAAFETFEARTLAYIEHKTEDNIRAVYRTRRNRQDALFDHLNRGGYLLVLDGFERALNAYSQIDVSRVSDFDVAEQTEQLEDSPMD